MMSRETRMRRIWETIREIPRGCVANYGQVAEGAGPALRLEVQVWVARARLVTR